MPDEKYPQLVAAINEGVNRGLHTGVQVYVSLHGKALLNDGFGEASPGVPMSADTIMLWRSAGKPITATAVLQASQSGLISPDAVLEDYLPEAAGTNLANITIRQMLCHSSGIPVIDTGWPQSSPGEILHNILAIEQRIQQAAYQPQSTWFLLAEVLRRTDPQARDFQSIISTEIFERLGIQEVWCGIANADSAKLSLRLPTYYVRDKGQLVFSDYSSGLWLSQPSPGGNIRGPIAGLGKFYESFLAVNRSSSLNPLLAEDTILQMTTPQRHEQFDATLQHVIDFGLGVILNSNQHGLETVPYGFGRYSSPESFGHGGAQCAMGLIDPAHQLVVAWAANGFCGEGQHQRRNRSINEAIYADLGLA